ncbi:MAG: hypothetical protein AABY11_00085 [archaeon]
MVEKKVEITRIDPLLLGKINALFGLVVGLIVGMLTLLTSGIVSGYLQTLTGIDPAFIEQTQQFGFIGLLLSLLFGVVLGFITGAGSALIYNVVAKIVGGITVWTEE